MAAFIDSNVLIFLTTTQKVKQDKAMALLADQAVVSVQVLYELIDISRADGLDWTRTGDFVEVVATLAKVQSLTLETNRLARRIGEKYDLTFHDGMLVASALEAGCDTIYSAELPAGMRFEDKLVVVNPFA